MKLRYLYRTFKARYRDEKSELQAALAIIRPGDTVSDIGANKGSYLYWMQKAVGGNGKVFAFEPQPKLASYLEAVRLSMHWENVEICDCALSDSTGTGRLNVPGQNDSPGASLEAIASPAGTSHHEECRVDTLDRQLAGQSRISFLKMDVEGHELNVFRGAKEILTRHAPALLFECEARHLRSHSMTDVFNYLKAFGYTGNFFSPDGLQPLAEFDPARHQKMDGDRFWDAPDYCNNFLFLSETRKGMI
ncbi:MAG: FkbM family methyltransferase [Limisphaerales bacterium]